MSFIAEFVRKSFFIPAYQADLNLIRSYSILNALPFHVHNNDEKYVEEKHTLQNHGESKFIVLRTDVWNLLHKNSRQSIDN